MRHDAWNYRPGPPVGRVGVGGLASGRAQGPIRGGIPGVDVRRRRAWAVSRPRRSQNGAHDFPNPNMIQYLLRFLRATASHKHGFNELRGCATSGRDSAIRGASSGRNITDVVWSPGTEHESRTIASPPRSPLPRRRRGSGRAGRLLRGTSGSAREHSRFHYSARRQLHGDAARPDDRIRSVDAGNIEHRPQRPRHDDQLCQGGLYQTAVYIDQSGINRESLGNYVLGGSALGQIVDGATGTGSTYARAAIIELVPIQTSADDAPKP